MKQGDWAGEWKRSKGLLETDLKKANASKIVEGVHKVEAKNISKAAKECDDLFNSYKDADVEDHDKLLKGLSRAHDSYRSAKERYKKSLLKAAKKQPDLVKVIEKVDAKNDPIDKHIGETIFALQAAMSARRREERKIENISKALSDEVKKIKKFVSSAQGDKTGEKFSDGITDAGEGLHGLLTEIAKIVKKKKEIDDSKSPPKKLIGMAKDFTDPGNLDCTDDDGNVDVGDMKYILKALLDTANLVETWRKKTWPK